MRKFVREICVVAGLLAAMVVPAVAQDPGHEPATAIPFLLGSTVEDIGDRVQRQFIHYRIPLARGQKISVSIRPAGSTTSLGGMWVGLFAPSLRARPQIQGGPTAFLNNQPTLVRQQSFREPGSMSVEVAASGDYFVVLFFLESSIRFALRVEAEGTPIAVPNPATAGCLSGRVDSITYSLQLIAAGLPDEVVIGGAKACASCQVKAPLYPEISNRLENALRSRINVEACYDSGGNIFQIKMAQ